MILRQALASTPAYQGHMADGSSIQKHSAGTHYPYVVAFREIEHNGSAVAEVLDPAGFVLDTLAYNAGTKADRLAAYEWAYDRAERRAKLRAQ